MINRETEMCGSAVVNLTFVVLTMSSIKLLKWIL